MTSGDLQALRELLGLDYKKCLYLFGPSRGRGALLADRSNEPVQSKETALLIRLLLNYPQFVIGVPEENSPSRLIDLIAQVAAPGAAPNAGREPSPAEIVRWFEEALKRPEDYSTLEVLKKGLAFSRSLQARLDEFMPFTDDDFPLRPLSQVEQARANELMQALFKRQKRKSSHPIHIGRIGVILGKGPYSGYSWLRQGDMTRLSQPTQRLVITVKQMIERLGCEGLRRYLLIVDEDAYAEGAPMGLMSYYTDTTTPDATTSKSRKKIDIENTRGG